MVIFSIGKEWVSLKDELIRNSVIQTNRENMDAVPDYEILIFEISKLFKKKKLLKRVYDLAEYLYLYEDGE